MSEDLIDKVFGEGGLIARQHENYEHRDGQIQMARAVACAFEQKKHLIVEAATDNKNRTAAEIRSIFSKNNGNLASAGSVSYMFHRKGRITIPQSSIDEDRLLELALEAGAEELTTEEDEYVITTSHDQLYAVVDALKNAGVTTDGQKFTFIPDTTVPVADETVARQVLRLCDALEDDDDVQNVYSNLEIPDELLARLPA